MGSLLDLMPAHRDHDLVRARGVSRVVADPTAARWSMCTRCGWCCAHRRGPVPGQGGVNLLLGVNLLAGAGDSALIGGVAERWPSG